MSKKEAKPKLGADPLAWIKDTTSTDPTQTTPEQQEKPAEVTNDKQQTIEELAEAYKSQTKRRGRKPTIKRKIEKTSQTNLPESWTRATFIVQESLLEDLKDLAYTERKTITDIINEAIEQFTQGKELIRRPRP